jgi:uncharacterized UBP type Zn finger protein
MKTYQRVKINQRFKFELEFSTQNFLNSQNSDSTDSCDSLYELSGILLHRGDAYSGHYHTYLRDTVLEGQWELFDEFETIEEEEEEIEENG